MTVTENTIKTLRKLNREDPSLKTKPTVIIEDKRTKRNRTKREQKRKAIEDQLKN
jgi:uncharacterized protein (UPF0218 family)